MPHQLETAIGEAIKTQRELEKKAAALQQDLQASIEREAVCKGQIAKLEDELRDSKARADHYLRWNVEITKQIQNIGMFVDDALKIAHIEVAKGNSGRSEAIAAVEQALIGVEDASGRK